VLRVAVLNALLGGHRLLAGLPLIIITTLGSTGVIHATLALALAPCGLHCCSSTDCGGGSRPRRSTANG
jgi:hypothetical protein